MSVSNRETPKLEISLHQLIRCLFAISIAGLFAATPGCAPTSAQQGDQATKPQTAAEIETARVAKLLSDRGAVLTKDADGKIIGFQLPESLALSETAWGYEASTKSFATTLPNSLINPTRSTKPNCQ